MFIKTVLAFVTPVRVKHSEREKKNMPYVSLISVHVMLKSLLPDTFKHVA